MGTKYAGISISGYNSSPPSDDGATNSDNQLQWSKHLNKIGNPIKTAFESANTALVTALDQSARSVSADDDAIASDHNRIIEIASTVTVGITITLSDAATMADGYVVNIHNLSAVDHTLARDEPTDLINGTATDVPIAAFSQIRAWVNASEDGYLVAVSNQSAAVPLSGGTMTGDLTIEKSLPKLTLDSTAANNSAINLARSGTVKWVIFNAGGASDFFGINNIGRAADDLIIDNTTGAWTIGGSVAIGGASIVQNSQSAAYVTVAADANKHLLHPTADNNARTFTIAANASVPYAVGTCITFINEIHTLTIAINSDTLVLAGAGTTGSRTLAAMGMATAIKKTSTSWIISGTGLS